MSAAVALPPLPPCVVLQPARDAASEAVLRFFEGVEAQGDAFDHLVALCCNAVRPYSLPAREGISTREWIEAWLSGFLAHYHGRTRDELIAAADKGEFRYVGRQCKLRLIDVARKKVPPHVSLDDPVGHDEDGNELTRLDLLGTTKPNAPSSLALRNSFEDFVGAVSSAFRAIVANGQELMRLDLLDGLRAVLANAEHLEHESSADFHARVVRSVASLRNISLQAGRDYLRKFRATVEQAMKAGSPALRAIYLELETQPPSPHNGAIP
jgi:hypothetical protein